jgi:hypothetical protein
MLECQQYHPECLRTLSSRLPSRVIDVGDDRRDPFLFLSHHQPGQWVALSHCWGQRDPLMTTLANFEDMCTRITLDHMPQLYQDAVQITRLLGYQYLWIDSLCIIQDSVDDWRMESRWMGETYSEAQVTLAAEACVDSLEGIFHKASTLRPQNIIEIAAIVSDEELRGNIILDPNVVWSAEDCRGPLSSRLWTLQENLLSRRTLLFAEQQVWWKCREMQRNERRPQWGESSVFQPGSNLEPHGQWDTQHVFPLTSMSGRIKGMTPVRQLTYFQPLQCWYRTVHAFCLRKATYRSDIFPAISGIAREYYRHIYQDYKAGLWNEDMQMGLVWSVPYSGVIKDKEYVAPSFSWASLDFSTMERRDHASDEDIYDHELVNYPPKNLKAEILMTNIQNVTSDPFGQVESGNMRLTAPCTTVCSCMIQTSFLDCRSSDQYSALKYDVFRRGYKIKPQDTPECDQCTVEYHLRQPCAQQRDMLHEMYLYLHVLSHGHDPSFAFALILSEAPGNTGAYQREGLAILKETANTSLIWPSRTLTIV